MQWAVLRNETTEAPEGKDSPGPNRDGTTGTGETGAHGAGATAAGRGTDRAVVPAD